MTQMPPLGERIRQARRAKGMTQEQMAQAIGSKLRAVQRWESGQGAPSWLFMQRLEEQFGVLVPRAEKVDDLDAMESFVRSRFDGADEELLAELGRRLAARPR